MTVQKIVVVNNESKQKTVQRAYLKITKMSHLKFLAGKFKNPNKLASLAYFLNETC